MISPIEFKKKYKIDENIENNITLNRKIISNIIHKKDNRLLVIVGPCSIHNIDEGLEYAKNIQKVKNKYPNLFIVMRTYFEKPRSTIGWKGLINDPFLNESFNIEEGIKLSRKFLLEVNKVGLATATEFLDNMTLCDISDLISWGAIGARTTESQIHREFSSGLNMPIGFKNSTNGDIQVALDAMISSNNSHCYLGINNKGNREIIKTNGNKDSHIILRGGKGITNFDKVSISTTSNSIKKLNINTGIMIDASHANSNKDYKKQKNVILNIAKQINDGNKEIIGVMIESNILEGSQNFNPKTDDISNIKYGISITDGCINLDETYNIFQILNDSVENRKNK